MKNRILLAVIALFLTGSFITSCSKEKIHDLGRHSRDDKGGRSSGQSSSSSSNYDNSSNSGSGNCGDHGGSSGSNSGSGSGNN